MFKRVEYNLSKQTQGISQRLFVHSKETTTTYLPTLEAICIKGYTNASIEGSRPFRVTTNDHKRRRAKKLQLDSNVLVSYSIIRSDLTHNDILTNVYFLTTNYTVHILLD